MKGNTVLTLASTTTKVTPAAPSCEHRGEGAGSQESSGLEKT